MKVESIGTNQTVITKANGDQVLVSYSTPVAACIGGTLYKSATKFSNTTTKHINAWGAKNAEPKPQEFFDSLL